MMENSEGLQTTETKEPMETTGETPPAKKKEKLSLSVVSQYRNELFGLSIIGIIIFHFCESVLSQKTGDGFYVFAMIYNCIFSSSGVEIFLFLSGMGLFYSMKKNSNVLQFYSKRFRRVLIPYLMFGLIYWIINDFVLLQRDFGQFISDFFLITVWTEGVRRFWFISFILILYIVFPLFFHMLDTTRKNRGVIFVLLMAICVTACALLASLAPDVYGNIELAICRLPAFLFGVYYGGKIYNGEKFGILEWILIPLGLVIRVLTFAVRYQWLPRLFEWNIRYETCLFAVSLLFVLAILLAKLHCAPLNKALSTVGTYSFELYITHVAIRSMMHVMGYPVYILSNYLICIAIAVVLSLLLHKLTDLILGGGKKKSAKQMAA